MMKYLLLLVSVVLFCNGKELHLPPDFPVCKRSEADINKCVKDAVGTAMRSLRNGLPEFKFDPAEPVEIPEMTIGEGTGVVHVTQKFKDVKIYGIPDIEITNAKAAISDTEFTLDIEGIYKEVRLEAKYDLNGRILVLPIVGTGDCIIKLKEMKVDLKITGKVSEHKGKDHATITEFKVLIDPKDVEFLFKNLFNGDEALGKQMNGLLNENNHDVFKDVKSGYEEILGTILANRANLIVKKVPYDEIFPK